MMYIIQSWHGNVMSIGKKNSILSKFLLVFLSESISLHEISISSSFAIYIYTQHQLPGAEHWALSTEWKIEVNGKMNEWLNQQNRREYFEYVEDNNWTIEE